MFGLDESSGSITLSDTVSIIGNMPCHALAQALETLSGKPCHIDPPQRPSVVRSGVFTLDGTEAACLCLLQDEVLHAIEFILTGGTAQQQRGFFFRSIGRTDPCPEKMRSVLLRYTFGTAWISTDQRSGNAALRITYAVKE